MAIRSPRESSEVTIQNLSPSIKHTQFAENKSPMTVKTYAEGGNEGHLMHLAG